MSITDMFSEQIVDKCFSKVAPTVTEGVTNMYEACFEYLKEYMGPFSSIVSIPSNLVSVAVGAAGMGSLDISSPTVPSDFASKFAAGFVAMFAAVEVTLPNDDKISAVPNPTPVIAGVAAAMFVPATEFSESSGILSKVSATAEEAASNFATGLNGAVQSLIPIPPSV